MKDDAFVSQEPSQILSTSVDSIPKVWNPWHPGAREVLMQFYSLASDCQFKDFYLFLFYVYKCFAYMYAVHIMHTCS